MVVRAYWKRFAGSVTGFVHKYRNDVLYRTGWHVVLLQIGLAVFLLLLVATTVSLLYDEIVVSLLASFQEIITSGQVPPSSHQQIALDLEYDKQRAIVLASTGVLALAATFGWLITKLALVPTRNALEHQKQFIANIAHEIRTPLSIIKTNTEVTLFNERLDAETKEALESNVEELDRVSEIINNLLSLGSFLRPEKIEFTNVDLGPVAERAIVSLRDLAEHKDIRVSFSESDYRTVWGNAPALEQIVMNLLKNALNYTPQGGSVKIAIEPNYRGYMELTVEDTGVGIPQKDLDHIFEPFYRGDQSRNRKTGSSGLGLAIVSELVKLHKGRILIKSVLGAGTSVLVTLRCGKTLSRKTLSPRENQVVLDHTRVV